jgi:Ni,Fe-hydrogenase III small subunit/ferredoxin
MILDIAKQSLLSPRVLITGDELMGNAKGSRMPEVNPELLTLATAEQIAAACPTSALKVDTSAQRATLSLDYGECIGCGRCFVPSNGAFFPAERLTCCGVGRLGLVRKWDLQRGREIVDNEAELSDTARQIRSIVGGALNIRQLDAGSCNGCEAEIVALNSPYYDLERFGIHFVASPKHADMLLVTGPVTRNMTQAVKETYSATPSPKLVVAVGACGVSGGIFADSYAVTGPVDAVIPVNAYIPGCPPTPAMLLTGILQVLRGSRLAR